VSACGNPVEEESEEEDNLDNDGDNSKWQRFRID
jgi:hypothetical protein